MNNYMEPGHHLHGQNRQALRRFLRPLYHLLKAAIQPGQQFLLNNQQGRPIDWSGYIKTRKWNVLPRLTAVVRFFNRYEVDCRDPEEMETVTRGLQVWKVCPNPLKNVPGMSFFFNN